MSSAQFTPVRLMDRNEHSFLSPSGVDRILFSGSAIITAAFIIESQRSELR